MRQVRVPRIAFAPRILLILTIPSLHCPRAGPGQPLPALTRGQLGPGPIGPGQGQARVGPDPNRKNCPKLYISKCILIHVILVIEIKVPNVFFHDLSFHT
jgi:hypothetical protein